MRQSCPKSCPSLQHPEAGFYRKSCKSGEIIMIERSHTSSIVFIIKGACVIGSNERTEYHVTEKHVILCYQDYNYELKAEALKAQISLTQEFLLDSKSEHDAFREAMVGNIVARVTDGTIN
jgi:hypothetical protein